MNIPATGFKTGLIFAFLTTAPAAFAGQFPKFREHVINPNAGTGLAITVADINGDERPDIVGVSSKDVAWYENPTWKRHLMAERLEGSNVCIAGNDLDSDGTPEFVLGADWQFNNTTSGGTLFLLRNTGDVYQPWDAITLLNEEPTLHRIRWADVEGDGNDELIVAPLKGRGSTGPGFQERGVDLFLLRPGANPFETPWERDQIDNSLHVLHNIWPQETLVITGTGDRGQRDVIWAASFEGVTTHTYLNGEWTKAVYAKGNPEPLPNSGAGEVKTGRARYTRRGVESWKQLVATIEPWHGHQVVVYALDEDLESRRNVLDDTLQGGHAIWWADFDKDGVDELLCGFREPAGPNNLPGLNVYDLDVNIKTGEVAATKYIIDNGGMATEDALAADINGDGFPDAVAFGRATHNIKYYENLGPIE